MNTSADDLTIMIVEEDIRSGVMLQQQLYEHGCHDIRIIPEPGVIEGLLKKTAPDLLYLHLDGDSKESGLSLLKYIEGEKIHTHVVITCSEEDFVRDVIHYSVLDFLRKPLTKESIGQSLEKLKAHKQLHRPMNDKMNGNSAKLIEINGNKEVRYYHPQRIILVVADGNYSHLYMEDGRKETVTQNLGKLEEKLPRDYFMRISRKSIVNTNFIRRLNKQTGEMEIECNGNIVKTIASMKYMNSLK